MVEESPMIDCGQEDSGYITNTPLSCELVRSFEHIRSLEMAMGDIGDQTTPVATGSKMTRQSYKTLEGILIDSIQPSKKDDHINKMNNKPIFVCGSRKRVDSLPNLSFRNRYLRMGFSPIVQRFRSYRLSSVDSAINTQMYRGWLGLDIKKKSPPLPTHIDFIHQLSVERFLSDIAIKIFGYLGPEDLSSASSVSVLWRNLIKNDVILGNALKVHNANLKSQAKANRAIKENIHGFVEGNVVRRVSCSDIMNVVTGRSKIIQPLLKPNMTYEKERNKDGFWRRLCPRCGHLAQVEENAPAARCLRDECGLVFCSKCLFRVHIGKDCKAVGYYSPTRVVIGSNKSKKNLKRL